MTTTRRLMTTEIYSITVLEAKIQNQGVSRAEFHSKTLGKNLSCLLQLLVPPGVPWLVASAIQPPPVSLHGFSSVYVSSSPVIELAQVDNPGSHLEVLNCICKNSFSK
jgi:hypothetical protein